MAGEKEENGSDGGLFGQDQGEQEVLGPGDTVSDHAPDQRSGADRNGPQPAPLHCGCRCSYG